MRAITMRKILTAILVCGLQAATLPILAEPQAGTTSGGGVTAVPPDPGRGLGCNTLPFAENVYWTTEYGPAQADVLLGKANLVPCSQGDYALCYYAGAQPAPCEVDEVSGTAACECERFTASTDAPYYVDINGILNTCVYIETITACGQDGAKCSKPDSAPVCAYILANRLLPNADLISTFSFETVGSFKLGCTNCDRDVYAGCMTAPCFEREGAEDGDTVVCNCPLYRGPYQFGRRGEGLTCDAGDGLVWSAAYNPDGCPDPEGSGGR